MSRELPERDAVREDPAIGDTVLFRMMVAMNLTVKPFIETLAHNLDLSLSEWRCMMALASVPGSSGQEVARVMGIDQMTVSRSLRRLEKTDRAFRRTDPLNRKRFQWWLSETGWLDYDTISPSALAREKEILSPLSKPQKALLREALDAIIINETT